MSAFELLDELFAHPRASEPYGEDVTIADHMLQTAVAAEAAKAAPEIVVAGLVHDLGHLVDHWDLGQIGNPQHAQIGAELLTAVFPPAVTEPVRLHVPAKRYLVATDPEYAALLSPASVQTLVLQGGPFDDEECERFLAEPFHDDAVTVRRFDEAGKVAGQAVPPLDHFRSLIDEVARA